MRGIPVDASCRVDRKARGNGRGSGWRQAWQGETRGWLGAVDEAVGCQKGARGGPKEPSWQVGSIWQRSRGPAQRLQEASRSCNGWSAIRLLYGTSITMLLVRVWRYVKRWSTLDGQGKRSTAIVDLTWVADSQAMTREQSPVCHSGASPASDVRRRGCRGECNTVHTTQVLLHTRVYRLQLRSTSVATRRARSTKHAAAPGLLEDAEEGLRVRFGRKQQATETHRRGMLE